MDKFTFFAYQTGSTTGSTMGSTMTNTSWELFDGEPGTGGMLIASGSGLDVTGWTNINRVTETTTGANTDRPIMADEVNTLGMFLPAETYWLAWQTDGTPSHSGQWAPPITIYGQATIGNGLPSLDDDAK